eukprot:SAG11_NODE_5941_length_1428_cov_6.709556_1_plen_269_part_00
MYFFSAVLVGTGICAGIICRSTTGLLNLVGTSLMIGLLLVLLVRVAIGTACLPALKRLRATGTWPAGWRRRVCPNARVHAHSQRYSHRAVPGDHRSTAGEFGGTAHCSRGDDRAADAVPLLSAGIAQVDRDDPVAGCVPRLFWRGPGHVGGHGDYSPRQITEHSWLVQFALVHTRHVQVLGGRRRLHDFGHDRGVWQRIQATHSSSRGSSQDHQQAHKQRKRDPVLAHSEGTSVDPHWQVAVRIDITSSWVLNLLGSYSCNTSTSTTR